MINNYTPEQKAELYEVAAMITDMQKEGYTLEDIAARYQTTPEAITARIKASNIHHTSERANRILIVFNEPPQTQEQFITEQLRRLGIKWPPEQ